MSTPSPSGPARAISTPKYVDVEKGDPLTNSDGVVVKLTDLPAKPTVPNVLRRLGVHEYDLLEWMTSWCMGQPALFGFRLLVCIHMSIILVVEFFYKKGLLEMTRFPFYFTYISNALTAAYFGNTAYYTARGYLNDAYALTLARSKSPWSLYLLHFLYTSSFTFHMLVPSIYWALLFDPQRNRDFIDWWTNISTHCLPICFMLIDFTINNRYTVVFAELVPILISMVGYMLWAWLAALLHFKLYTKVWWVYKFLNFLEASNGVWYVVLFSAVAIFFTITWALHRLKASIARRHIVNK